MMRFIVIAFNIFLVCTLVLASAAYFALRSYQAPSDLEKPINFIVKKGDGFNRINDNLYEKNIVKYPTAIKIFASLYGLETKIKAGEYEFPAHITPQDAIAKMVDGVTVQHKITIVEGKTVHDMIEKIKAHEALTGDITIDPKEGTLMPETYTFTRDMKRDDLIALIKNNMKKFLQEEWEKRDDNLPIATPIDALILASIVEKETGISSERSKVASVFINRLRKKMRLQSDPTIIYGITKGKHKMIRPIYRSDIISDQDGYNTYVIDALPPTPICNPSPAAIKAVLHPAETDYLFFVADGTGGHAFATTLQGHNDNVKKWRKIEREMKKASQK